MMKQNFILIILLSYFYTSSATTSLDQLALKFGTDKSSQWHNYAEVYDNYLIKKRNDPIVFVEIGFGSGNSAYMWEAYFPNAEIHIIDIDHNNCFARFGTNLSSRCTLHKADQSDPTQLQKILEKIGKKIDILIDDGGHTMKQQLVSFVEIFPHIKDNGLYIIEDLHTSYTELYKNEIYLDLPNKQTMINFLKDLVDDVNFVGKMSGIANKNKFNQTRYTNYYQQHIKSIHFYTSLAFIFKTDT